MNISLVPVWQRLEELMHDHGIPTMAELSRRTQISQASLSHIRSGTHGISPEIQELLKAAFPTVNLGWLITGDGPVYFEATDELSRKLGLHRIPIYTQFDTEAEPFDYYVGASPMVNQATLAVRCLSHIEGITRMPKESLIFLRHSRSVTPTRHYVITRVGYHFMGYVQQTGDHVVISGDDNYLSQPIHQRSIMHRFEVLGYMSQEPNICLYD